MISEVMYQDNGEYPDPEEIMITKGRYRIKGSIPDFTPDEATQYIDFDAALESEGELKRIHFNKLDVLSNGSFVAEVDVIDNWFNFVVFGALIGGIVLAGASVSIVLHYLEKLSPEEVLEKTAVNLQWVAVICGIILTFSVIRLWK